MKGRSPLSALLWLWLLASGLPLVWLYLTSLKPSRDIFTSPFAAPDPAHLAWGNYQRAWTVGHFGTYFGNSLGVTALSVVLTVALGAMLAFALARFEFPGRSLLLPALLAGMVIPLQVAVVPLFFELRGLHLLNSRMGLVLVYVATGLPFAVFILTGFFRSLPQELYEAAILDGCTPVRAFWSVMLPLARPGLVTVAVFTFLGIWNEYFLAFMFLSGEGSESLKTLPLGLANLTIVSQYRTDFGLVFAGLAIVITPSLLVFLRLQRDLTAGITMGALK